MKQPYVWDYTIRIKTKEGTYEYEDVSLEDMTLLVLKHPEYTELQATHRERKEHKENTKRLVKKK